MEEPVAGFVVPVHRALTEPILMGGAPRSVAIINGTLAAALGLGLRLWIAGLVLWFIGLPIWLIVTSIVLLRRGGRLASSAAR